MNKIIRNEDVLYNAKPFKFAYVLEKITSQLPMVIMVAIVNLSIIVIMEHTAQDDEFSYGLIKVFLIFWLMVSIIPLFQILTSGIRWKNEEYALTDKRIIIKSGLIGTDYQTIPYENVSNIILDVKTIGKLTRTGNIVFETNNYNYHNQENNKNRNIFKNIKDPYNVYQDLQEIVLENKKAN